MPRYNVNRPVKLGNKIHKGPTVECSEKQAAPYLDSGALSAGGQQSGQPPQGVTAEQFAEAVAKLEQGNEKHWTQDGKPEVGALKDVAGLELSAKERNQLWKDHQKGQE